MQRLHFIIFLLFIFISFIGINPLPEADTDTSDKTESILNLDNPSEGVVSEWEQQTTLALKKECGACHQSSMIEEATTALDIFDLDQTNWADQLNQETLKSIKERAIDEFFTEPEISAIRNFMEYQLVVKSP